MSLGQTVLVACTIESGAFSGERIVQLPMADENPSQYSGVSPVRYCLDGLRKPLGRDQPAKATVIEGYIEAILIANGSDRATVELPDGQAIRVNVSQVRVAEESRQKPNYVPI